uniref:Trafficking protein particle complex subunit n=1 Tax=Trypanosoma congolense (strain IL3000) TaxID=1068625 RepID=G0USU0_TRYCI|nr:conserved hypothetical protein [Trypanosoma congolense IL3000]
MNQVGFVSESVVTELTVEVVSYVLHGVNEKGIQPYEDDIGLNSKSVEKLGLFVGLRLAERLLYREVAFGGSTPTDVARFIGQHVWRTAFGKKIDRMKHMDKVYFCLIDNNFRWLQGFTSLKAERVVSNTDNFFHEFTGKPGGNSETAVCLAAKTDGLPHHNDVLRYTVGILRGITQIIYPGGTIRIHASRNENAETQFVLDFRQLVA